ncbi:MAG: hypothetical protein DRP59_11265 [Spirochaetes bacterium]|nr:MAG: hypothetical protein DRP59_11265 [Spirochaetota bacterium]
MTENSDRLPGILVALLKGVVYREDNIKRWQDLIDYQGQIRDYLSLIGLDLLFFEDEGFAFLKNKERDNEESEIPRLIIRRQLSYPVSLLIAQLRRKLAEHDASSGEERLIIDKQEIINIMETFFVSGSNEVQFTRKIDSALQKAYELGFIRFLGDKKEKIEIKRIIKAFVDAQWLQEFDTRIEEYREYGRSNQDTGDISDE